MRDILDAIAAIERHPGQDKLTFERDELLQVWFLRHLQIMVRRPEPCPVTCGRRLQRYPGRRSSGCGTYWFTGLRHRYRHRLGGGDA